MRLLLTTNASKPLNSWMQVIIATNINWSKCGLQRPSVVNNIGNVLQNERHLRIII